MRITDLKGYALYVSRNRKRVMEVMDGDNEGHYRAVKDGYRQTTEVEYWLVRLKQEREENDRQAIERALQQTKVTGYGAEVL